MKAKDKPPSVNKISVSYGDFNISVESNEEPISVVFDTVIALGNKFIGGEKK